MWAISTCMKILKFHRNGITFPTRKELLETYWYDSYYIGFTSLLAMLLLSARQRLRQPAPHEPLVIVGNASTTVKMWVELMEMCHFVQSKLPLTKRQIHFAAADVNQTAAPPIWTFSSTLDPLKIAGSSTRTLKRRVDLMEIWYFYSPRCNSPIHTVLNNRASPKHKTLPTATLPSSQIIQQSA
jgi:hypothetical protein